MKQIYRATLVVVASLFVVAALPHKLLALEGIDDSLTSSKVQEIKETQDRKRSEATAKLTELCRRYSQTSIPTNVKDRRGDLNDRLKEREGSLSTQRSEWDSKRLESRTVADERRQEHYAKLLEAAQTDGQKAAVEAFRGAVELAVVTRRQSQDSARTVYRDGLDVFLNNRRTEIEDAAGDFEQSVEAALAKAKTSCENGTPVDTVTAAIKSDLENAKNELKLSKESIPDVAKTADTLLSQRKASLESAKSDFESALEKARSDLKEAFAQ